MKKLLGWSLFLLTAGLATLLIVCKQSDPKRAMAFVYDEPSSQPGGKSDRLRGSHAAANSGYYAYFANFTTRFKFIDSPGDNWEGRWKDPSLLRSDTLAKLRANEGPTTANFSFEPGINKSWMNLSIKEGPYADSNYLHLSINLKMSRFDKATSTFTVNCQQWDEYFASGLLVEDYYTTSPRDYFDMSFQVQVKDRRTGQPADLDFYRKEDVTVEYSLRSANLGLNVQAEMVYSTSAPYGTLFGLLSFAVLLVVFVISWSENYTYTPAFIQNVGFEVPALLMLLYFHFFCIGYESLLISRSHFLFLLGSTAVMLLFSFFWLAETIHFMSVEDMMRRQRPHRARAEVYTCLFFTVIMIAEILLAIFSRRLMMHPVHKYVLLGFFAYPLLQVAITLVKANNKHVFKVGYQVLNWWPPLLIAAAVRGGLLEQYVNLTPWPLLVPIAAGSLFFGGFIMFLQHKIGVYFFMPGFIVPKSKNLVVPVASVPQEKLEDLCSICYFRITTDPEKAAAELQEVEANQDRSDASESMLPKVTEVMKLDCNHFFHVPCLKAWLATKQTCPVCNQPVVYYDF